MFYDPAAYTIGFRDVIAACLVCLAVAAMGLAYSAARADRAGVTADAITAPSAVVGRASIEARCC